VDLRRSQGGKSNHPEEPDRGTFWRGTALDVDTRLRVGRAIGKNEEEVAAVMLLQIRDRCNPIELPAIYGATETTVILRQCLKPGESCLNTLVEEGLQHENNRSLVGNAFT
jgi:hypothetical protein